MLGGMTKTARVLIVDDHEIVRMGLRILLAGYPQFEICGEAVDGRQALAKVAELLPDVVIKDLSKPVMNGFDATKELRQTSPDTKIVLFSMYETPTTARMVGAHVFVAKSAAARDLPAAIEGALRSKPAVEP